MRGGAANPVRLRYTKRGKVRWISHRDVARALERAFRITQLPLAFTEGFSPRPKVSFGLALSTGHESDAEYIDLVFAEEVELETLSVSLTEALPEGMEVSPDGSQLFVGLTYAHRIAVYDVDGFRLKRNPYVLRVGHGPCSMAIGPRFAK